MIEPFADRRQPITLAADKSYDIFEFVMELRARAVTPHVAQNTSGRRSASHDPRIRRCLVVKFKQMVPIGSESFRGISVSRRAPNVRSVPLGGFADQNLVGDRCGASADAEQGIKGSMPCAAPIEAEHEFIEVVLKVGFAQPVRDAQAPALEV